MLGLHLAFRDRKLAIASQIPHARTLTRELELMRRQITPAAHERYEPAQSSAHNAPLMAVSLAICAPASTASPPSSTPPSACPPSINSCHRQSPGERRGRASRFPHPDSVTTVPSGRVKVAGKPSSSGTALLILGLSLLRRIPPSSVPGKIAQYLFFLPIAVAVLRFGWKGGLIAAGACALGYLSDLIIPWRDHQYTAEEMGEALDLILVGSIFGILAERDRRQTRELERNTQFQESFEHLKRGERLSAVGQLTANLAHEIRNPLASIEGAAGLLEPGSLHEQQRTELGRETPLRA
jgi:hypothetical protein